jgi:probable HAF family extracellular repeat protein
MSKRNFAVSLVFPRVKDPISTNSRFSSAGLDKDYRTSRPTQSIANLLSQKLVEEKMKGTATRLRPLGLLFILLCCLVLPSVAQLYSVTDLGVLPGGTFSEANGINSLGQVVGDGDLSTQNGHAFLWTKERGLQDLGTLPGGNSWGEAVNDRGHVTGGSWINEADNAAILWTPQKGMQELFDVHDAPGGLAINDLDQVAGTATLFGGFVWGIDGLSYLTTPLGEVTQATGVNDSRQVVGSYIGEDGPQAFLWTEASGVEDLGGGSANAINPIGNVVGENSANHAFVWSKRDGMQDLGTLPGDTYSGALAINLWGMVVGRSDSNTAARAFLWTPWTGMQDLNTLIPADSGWNLIQATGVNVLGQIVGDGYVNGQPHGFLLTLQGWLGAEKGAAR